MDVCSVGVPGFGAKRLVVGIACLPVGIWWVELSIVCPGTVVDVYEQCHQGMWLVVGFCL